MRTSLPDGEAVPAESADLACLACPFRVGCQMNRERAPERREGRKSQAQMAASSFGMRKEKCRWPKAGPMPYSPSNAAWQTIVGPNSLIGGLVALPSDQKMGRARAKIAFADHSLHQDFFRSLGSLIVKMVPVCPGPSLRCLVLYSMLPLCMRMLNSESLIPMR